MRALLSALFRKSPSGCLSLGDVRESAITKTRPAGRGVGRRGREWEGEGERERDSREEGRRATRHTAYKARHVCARALTELPVRSSS